MTTIVASTEVERSAPEVFALPSPIPGASPSGSEAPPTVSGPTGPAQFTGIWVPRCLTHPTHPLGQPIGNLRDHPRRRADVVRKVHGFVGA
jgi:hypothetical protein